MKEIYDKSVEKIAKYSDELSDIDPYVFDKAIPLIGRELQDIIKSHTLSLIDAEIERLEGVLHEIRNTKTVLNPENKTSYEYKIGYSNALTDTVEKITDHITYLKEQRDLLE